jgi:hypothetical protein
MVKVHRWKAAAVSRVAPAAGRACCGVRLAAATVLIAALTTSHAAADPAPRLRTAKRQHLRMGAELAAVFALGIAWYWRDGGETNSDDWQLPNDERALGAKLGSRGWRFDDNAFYVNAIYHPGFGSVTHALARKNGYSLAESFLISTLASATWEVLAEWREYASINDLAVTSPAGIPIGEVAHQMLTHLRQTRLTLSTGVGIENGASLVAIAADGSLDRVPNGGTGSLGAGRRVAFGLELQSDGLGLRSVEGGARTLLAGRYHHGARGRTIGGITATFDYRNRIEREERDWDQLARLGFGPSIDYRTRLAGLTLEVGTDAYLALAMLKGQAFARWRGDHPSDAVRGVLAIRDRPYYYAAGASLDPRIRIARGRYLAGARLSSSVFGSVDGADAASSDSGVDLRDTDVRGQAYLGYRGPGMSVTLDGRLRDRRGRANEVTDAAGDRSLMVSVGYGM